MFGGQIDFESKLEEVNEDIKVENKKVESKILDVMIPM